MTLRAALLTPPGRAGIAVVRLMGDSSYRVLRRIFRPRSTVAWDHPSLDALLLGELHEDADPIDQVIVALDPDSAAADINCHGGPRIVQRLLLLLQKHGAQITSWQDLCPASSLAGEIALTLPLARTHTAVLALAAQNPAGLAAWTRHALQTLAADPACLPRLQKAVPDLLATFAIAQRLLQPSTVVLAGPVNAGKSTLANALTGSPQSLTADLPGTTRDWTVQLADIHGLPIHLIDTAGRRDTADPLERASLRQADAQIAAADLVVLVLDAAVDLPVQLAQQTPHLPSVPLPLIIVNKCDLLSPAAPRPDYLCVSALTAAHLDALRAAIAARLGLADFDPAAPLVFTPRQLNLLQSFSHAASPDLASAALLTLLG